MPKVIVVYDSVKGSTEKLAHTIAEGLKQVDGLEVSVKKVDDVKCNDLIEYDGIALGSPTYFGLMSNKIKKLVDETYDIRGKLVGKVGLPFVTFGAVASGSDTALLSLVCAMLANGMIVQGDNKMWHFGIAVQRTMPSESLEYAKERGRLFGELVKKLFSQGK